MICAKILGNMGSQDTPYVSRGEEDRDGAEGRAARQAPSFDVLVASPASSLRDRVREDLRGSHAVGEAWQWETLDKTISSVCPAVVLLDVELLFSSGIRDLSIIRRISRKTRIILLSDAPNDEEGVAALRAGARGYCHKQLPPPALRKAVDRVGDGEIWAERRLIPVLLDHFRAFGGEPAEQRAQLDRRLSLLTPRERDISVLIAAGASNRDIAARLMVGEGTVKAHLTAIFRKLGFNDRLQLGLFLANPNLKLRGKH
jgi:two-component system nitrate/nitrite response regulator NarL